MAGFRLTYDMNKELQEVESIERRMHTILMKAGLEGVNYARDNHSYTDRTGNLTSSIGCCVTDSGEQMYISDFKQVKEGSEGVNKGKELATDTSAPTNAMRLDVVAGMEYASMVEAGGIKNRKPRNVITFAQAVVEKEIEEGIKALFGK